jgi:hypothetical protein
MLRAREFASQASDSLGLVDDGRDRQCDLLFAGVAFALGGIAGKARGFYTRRAAQAWRANGAVFDILC